jgi:hypothetical protein
LYDKSSLTPITFHTPSFVGLLQGGEIVNDIFAQAVESERRHWRSQLQIIDANIPIVIRGGHFFFIVVPVPYDKACCRTLFREEGCNDGNLGV